jgi:S1-C subfamily serine protease
MGSELIPVLKPEVPMSLPNEPQPAVDQVSAKLYQDARAGVVRLGIDNTKAASGFLVDDAHVVTSARNLIGSKEQFAFGPDGKRYKLELEKLDDLQDLALLKVNKGKIAGTHSLPLGDTESLEADDKLWAIGFPKSAGANVPYLAPGYIRGLANPIGLLENVDHKLAGKLREKLNGMDDGAKSEAAQYLEKTAIENKLQVEPGFAGAPMLQKEGKVAAMTTLTSGVDTVKGQTMAAPVEDIKTFLAGNGRFTFSYKNVAADWAEQYKSDWQNDKLKAVVDTALTGAMVGAAAKYGYLAAERFPLVGSIGAAGISTFGLVRLSGDLNHLLQSTDRTDSWKYGLASLSDLGTAGGAAMALVPKLRGYGLAIAGIGLAGRAATDFITNHHVLAQERRIEGDPVRPPFNLDTLLGK